MVKLKIGCDLDSVLNDLNNAWLSYLNKAYDFDVRLSDVIEWDMKKAYPALSSERIYAPLYREDFWRNVKPIADSSKYLELLFDEGYDIYIVTNSNYQTMPTKIEWLKKHFPFIPIENVIITQKKQLINVDIMIDDYEQNLIGGRYNKILFDYPYNRHIDDVDYGIARVKNWGEIYNQVHMIQQWKDVFDRLNKITKEELD